MSVNELLPTLRELTRGDKLRVMQFLVEELARDEALLTAGDSYPVWSPYGATAAGEMLLSLLAAENEA